MAESESLKNGLSSNGRPTDACCDDKPAAQSFQLHQDLHGQLVLTDAQGREHVGVEAIRGFPLTSPSQGIALCDKEGRELFWIDDLNSLPASIREALEADLSRREFLPVIQRIVSVSSTSAPANWEVETDRGRTSFHVNAESDIRRVSDHFVLVTDAYGIRYSIPDIRKLSAYGRQLLEHYF